MKWEYKTEYEGVWKSNWATNIVDMLNNYGSEGWELVTVNIIESQYSTDKTAVYIFKRPIEEERVDTGPW